VATNSRLVYVSHSVVSVSNYRFLSRGGFVSYFLLDLNVDTWIVCHIPIELCYHLTFLDAFYMDWGFLRRMIIAWIKKKLDQKGGCIWC